MKFMIAVEVTKSNEDAKGAAQTEVRDALIEEIENSISTIEVENADGESVEYDVIFGAAK